MRAAAEPCTLARHWCETLHPENAIAQLKQNGVRALALQGRIVTREAVPPDCALHCADAIRHIEREYGEPMVIDAEYVRSEEHTSELQSLMRNSYAVFCLKKKKNTEDT